jgi:hypothetical protein
LITAGDSVVAWCFLHHLYSLHRTLSAFKQQEISEGNLPNQSQNKKEDKNIYKAVKAENKENINNKSSTITNLQKGRKTGNNLNVNVHTSISLPQHPSPLIGLKDRIKAKTNYNNIVQNNKNINERFGENKQHIGNIRIEKINGNEHDNKSQLEMKNILESIDKDEYDDVSVQQQNTNIKIQKFLGKNTSQNEHEIIGLLPDKGQSQQVFLFIFAYVYISISICTSICLYTYIYIYVYINMYIYMKL